MNQKLIEYTEHLLALLKPDESGNVNLKQVRMAKDEIENIKLLYNSLAKRLEEYVERNEASARAAHEQAQTELSEKKKIYEEKAMELIRDTGSKSGAWEIVNQKKKEFPYHTHPEEYQYWNGIFNFLWNYKGASNVNWYKLAQVNEGDLE